MAKEETRQQNPWEKLKGVKNGLSDEVSVKMEDLEVSFGIQFVDITETQDINQEYEERKPDKPVINEEVGGQKVNIRVPSEDPKYQAFNNHPKAQEWEEKCKPIDKKRRARLAYEFIADEDKPADDPEEGVKIIQDRLREIDVLDIVQAGFNLNGMSERLEDAEKNS